MDYQHKKIILKQSNIIIFIISYNMDDIKNTDSQESIDKVETFTETRIIEHRRHRQGKNEPFTENENKDKNKIKAKVQCNSCSCCS